MSVRRFTERGIAFTHAEIPEAMGVQPCQLCMDSSHPATHILHAGVTIPEGLTPYSIFFHREEFTDAVREVIHRIHHVH